MKKYRLEEICNFLKKDYHEISKEIKNKYEAEGLRCFFSTMRGMGGWTNRALLIPESIHIIISPAACARHGYFDALSQGNQKRVYRYCLSEEDIVLGKGVENFQAEIIRLIEGMEEKPRMVTICTTCVDALMHTDYLTIKRILLKKFGIRFVEIKMFPFLADSIKTHKDMLWESVYSGIECDKTIPKEKRINIIGRTLAMDEKSDFYHLLSKKGYEVQEIHHCKTIEEYDNMGKACLNVIVSSYGIAAAKMMERKYGIPYIPFFECMDEDMIAANYKKLGSLLGEKFEIDEYYDWVKKEINEFRQLAGNKTFASGGTIDHNPVKAARYLVKMGVNLKYFIVNQIKTSDLEDYKWLLQNSPHTEVYLGADTSMYGFIHMPEETDYTVGVEYSLLKNVRNVIRMKVEEEPYDFTSLIESVKMMKKTMNGGGGTPQTDYALQRVWSTYREEV